MNILNSHRLFFANWSWLWFNRANFLKKEVGFGLKTSGLEILCLTLEYLIMKKTLVAIAALAVVSAASAQVTLSGGVEIGVYSAIGKTAIIDTDRFSANNLTVAASEDLGGGLKASAMMQIRYSPATGGSVYTGYGSPFEQVKTSISGPFGSVDLGKYTPAVQTGWVRPFGDDGSLKAYSGGSTGRSASMIAYNTPTLMGLKAQIIKIQGENAAVPTNNDGMLTSLMYDANKIQAYLSVGSKMSGNGKVGATSTSQAPVFDGTQNDSKEYGIAYDFGIARVAVGQTKEKASAGGVESTETGYGVQVPMKGPLSLGLGYGKIAKLGDATDGQSKIALVANYSLSKRTTAIAKYLSVSDNATPTANGTGTFFGVAHTF